MFFSHSFFEIRYLGYFFCQLFGVFMQDFAFFDYNGNKISYLIFILLGVNCYLKDAIKLAVMFFLIFRNVQPGIKCYLRRGIWLGRAVILGLDGNFDKFVISTI